MESLATAKIPLVDAQGELKDKDVEIAKLKETLVQHARTVAYEASSSTPT
jgi:hypothetical protein